MKNRAWATVFVIFLGPFVLGVGVWAQVVTAQLSGQVKDPAGAVVVGANVRVRQTATGLVRTTLTNEAGIYVLPNLPAGEYELEVSAPGFRPHRQMLTLTVGQAATLDLVLEVGGVLEAVTVMGQEITLDPSKTEVSQVIEERRITDLPIIGRNFVDFVLLSPKVATGRASVGGGPQQEPPVGVGVTGATRLSFGGQFEYHTFIAVDGVDGTQSFTGLQRSAPSQEVAKEFRVVNTSYSAEFGRGFGLVNIITRSGGNEWHGTGYIFFRNEALDARNPLQRPELERLRQAQYGGVVSGPIVRDRTFFVANYEGQQRDERPIFSEVVLANLGAINAVRRQFGLSAEDLNVLTTNDYNAFFGKVDHQLSGQHTLTGRYNFVDGESLNVMPVSRASLTPSALRDNTLRDQALMVALTSVPTSQTANDFRFQYARRTFHYIPVRYNEPALEIPGLILMGHTYQDFDFYKESRVQFLDNFTYVAGAHSLKFGADFNHLRTTEHWVIWFPARVIFPSLAAFLGRPPFAAPTVAAIQWTPPELSTRLDPTTRALPGEWEQGSRASLTHHFLGFFAQDQWRVRPNFTLSYGLRWDAHLVPTDFVSRDLNNFQPRVGFSWSLGRTQSTVIRAGAGLFHDKYISGSVLISGLLGDRDGFLRRNMLPNVTRRNATLWLFSLVGPPVATPAFNEWLRTGIYPSGPAVRKSSLTLFDRENQQPYSIQSSLEIERRFGRSLFVAANYLFVRGLKLITFSGNLNAVPTGTHPVTGKRVYGARRFPEYDLVNPFFYASQSVYHGGTLQVRYRRSENMDVSLHYTFSKTIDLPTGIALQQIPEDPLNWRQDRGLSNQHVGHRFVLNFLTAVPSSWGVVRNFKLASIVTLQSARYFNVITGADTNGDGNPLTDRPGRLGRNTFKGDPYYSVDVRVSREIRLSERAVLEPLVELFNLFNTVNVLEYNTVWGSPDLAAAPSPDFGSVRSVAPARQMQLALRLRF